MNINCNPRSVTIKGSMKFSLPELSFECETTLSIADLNDDIKRELAFATQALKAAVKARRLVLAAKLPLNPPTGYFCEMLKTQEHMTKISKKVEEEKDAAKASEDARKQRLNRKYGKKIQKEKETERAVKRSEDTKKLTMMRKRKRTAGDDEFNIEIDNDGSLMEGGKDKGKVGPKKGRKGEKTVSAKRQARNEQYGFGNKKSKDKRNNKESADQDDFHVARNSRSFKGMKTNQKGGSKGKKTQQRPGKQRRMQSRSKKASNKK